MKKIITFLLLSGYIKGHSQMNYIIAPIVFISQGSTSVGGLPIVLNSKANCLVSSWGLSVLEAPSKNTHGIFNECKEIIPITERLSFNVYPNPTNTTSTLRINGIFDVSLSCSITILTYDGEVIDSKVVPMIGIQSGYLIDLKNNPSATYIISIGYKNQYYSLKLIKFKL